MIVPPNLADLQTKTPARLRAIKRRFHNLSYTSHRGGAGGIRGKTFDQYQQVVRECERLLKIKGG